MSMDHYNSRSEALLDLISLRMHPASGRNTKLARPPDVNVNNMFLIEAAWHQRRVLRTSVTLACILSQFHR